MVQEGILLRTGGGTVFLHPAIAQHLPEKRELGPRSDEGIATLSQRYRDLGLRERIDQELIPVCKRQLEKSRDRAAWYRALGVCELSKAQARQCLLEPLKSAIGNFLSALSYDPDDRDTCRYLGLAYYACFELTRSRQDLQEAIAALRMSQDAHELAKAQLQLARLDEDTALARQLAEVEELSPGLKAWAMLLVGEDSYLRRASELLAQEDANLPTATRLNLLGCCLHKLGRKDEAVNTFRSCLEVLDRRPHPYVESSSEEERSIIERNLQQVELSKFGPSSSGLVTR
jgi:tetratricopeptide (TPR) repeat protein